MSRRLAAVLLASALAACSAPGGTTCTLTSDCPAGCACNAGFCQQAVDVTITGGPSGLIATTTASFSFSSLTPGATFECKLDTDAAYTTCTSPKSYPSVPEGSRTFLVRGRVGENVAAPASRSWTIDVTGPVVNLTAYPVSPQSQDPSFTFSSPEAGATFECKLDGGSFAACASPKAYTGLSIGSHAFTVQAKDALGNPSTTPAAYTWTQAPETAITWAPLAVTNRATEKVAFSSTTPGATFECQLDGGGYTACTSPKSWALANGSHTVNVRALASGVFDPSPATTTFTVDTTNALLYYNFEQNGRNDGVLSPGSYGAVLSGAAYYTGSFVFSHGATGQYAVGFAALDGAPPTGRGWVTLSGVRNVLQHDLVPSDAGYTIALWYREPTPANVGTVNGLNPTIFDTRGSTGGFETYHGYNAPQPPDWGTCWSSGGAANCFWGPNAATNTDHRWVMEYAYNAGTTGYDLKLYVDGTLVASDTTAAGQAVFNSGQYDPTIGNDWRGYVDDLRIWNKTWGGSPPLH